MSGMECLMKETCERNPLGRPGLSLLRGRRLATLGAGLALLAWMAALAPAPVQAGAVYEIWATDPGNRKDPTDDRLVQTPIRWDPDGDPPRFAMYRAPDLTTVIPGSAIDPVEIYLAFSRALEQWNNVELSNFQFVSGLSWAEDNQRPYLPFGYPTEVALDGVNLVTFQDPTVAPPVETLATTSIFFMTEDFDFSPPDLAIEDYMVTFFTDLDVVELYQPEDIRLFFHRKKYRAGEIVETDISLSQEVDWYLFPEDEDDLETMTGLTRDKIRGLPDIQAVFTRELGHAAGIAPTQLLRPVMAATYRTADVETAPRRRTDPYEARKLTIDDKASLTRHYPSSGYRNAPGIGGEVRDGGYFTPGSAAVASVPFIPDVPVFFGRPIPFDSPYVTDGLDVVEEKDEGFILLEAMTFSGRNMRVIGSSGEFGDGGEPGYTDVPDINLSTILGSDFNGRFEIRGLQPDSKWYVYTTNLNEDVLWQVANRDIFGAFLENIPTEFYGGASPLRPRPGDGNAIDDNDPNNFIESRYLVLALLPLQTDPVSLSIRANGQFAVVTAGFMSEFTDPNGPDAIIADNGGFSAISSEFAGTVRRVLLNRGRPFGPAGADGLMPGRVTQLDDSFNRATIEEIIPDAAGTGIIYLTSNFQIRPIPGDDQPRYLVITWTLQNLSSERQSIGFAHCYEASSGSMSGGALEGLIVNDEPVRMETGYGAGYAQPVPDVIRYADVQMRPTFESRFMTTGLVTAATDTNPEEYLTPPSTVIAGLFPEMMRTNLFQYQPEGGRPLVNPYLDINDGSPDVNPVGLLLRWDPITVEPLESRVIRTAITIRRYDDGYADHDGMVPRADFDSIFDDDPEDGYPINIQDGRFADGVILYANTGSSVDFRFPSGDDYDLDGVRNDADNCPWVANSDQEESEASAPRGVVCVNDFDNDGIDDAIDNCPAWPNADQGDIDGDGLGDVCDDDIDGDGVPNCKFIKGHDLGRVEFINPNSACYQDANNDGVFDSTPEDNCPFIFNPDQEDLCSTDYDGDGIPNDQDNCPTIRNETQDDMDVDGVGDACDPDRDGDGVPNEIDNCPDTSNPPVGDTNPVQPDADGDGIGDACEGAGTSLSVDDTRLPQNDWYVNGAAFGDLNGDGYVDLVLAIGGFGNFGNASLTNRILINQGYLGQPGVFRDETFGINGRMDGTPFYDEPGQQFTGDDRMPVQFENTYDVKLVDFDLDGDLDIFFSNYSSISFTGKGQYGAPDRLMINRDINDPLVNPRVDNDDLGDGFFIDASDICLPGILNTKNMSGPNPLAYMMTGDPFVAINTFSTRSDCEDIDGDGDPDIVISQYVPFATSGFSYGGYPDLAGSLFLTWNSTTCSAARFWNDPLQVSELILINRRDELKYADGRAIPRGTPDAYYRFLEQSLDVRRAAGFNPDPDPEDYLQWNTFIPPPPSTQCPQPRVVAGNSSQLLSTGFRSLYGVSPYLGRRLDAFFFRDETLGRDGVFGGSARYEASIIASIGTDYDLLTQYPPVFKPVNFDRMPPLFGDYASTSPGIGNVETDWSLTREVQLVNFLGGSGADLAVFNNFLPRGGYNPEYRSEGWDFFYVNQDAFDRDGNLGSDGRDDGYFSMINFSYFQGTDGVFRTRAWSVLNDAGALCDLTIPEGWPEDANSPETSVIPYGSGTLQDNSMGGVAADFGYTGVASLFEYTDAGPFVMIDRISPAAVYRAGPLMFRGQAGTVFGYSRDLDPDGGGVWAGSSFANDSYFQPTSDSFLHYDEQILPARTGRTLHACVTDMNLDGLPDIVMAHDAPSGNIYQVSSGLGQQTLWYNVDGFNEAGSWSDNTQQSLMPNTPSRGAFVATADVDNDGDLDLFVGRFGQTSQLYINQFARNNKRPDQSFAENSNYVNLINYASETEKPIFYDQTLQTLPPHANQSAGTIPSLKTRSNVTLGVQVGDLDRDGDPDLIFLNGGDFTENGDESFIFFNHGVALHPYATKVFHPTGRIQPAPGVVSWGYPDTTLDHTLRPGFDALVFDYDLDGDLDLYVAYNGQRNRLYENRDARDPRLFEFYTAETGATFPLNSPEQFNTWTQYDTDPRDTGSFPSRALAQFLGDGLMDDVTFGRMPVQSLGPQNRLTSKRPAAGDVNADSFPDVLIANSLANAGAPNLLLLNPILTAENPTSDPFLDATLTKLPTRRQSGPGDVVDALLDNTVQALLADFNQDGLLDIFFVNQNATDPGVEIPGSSNYNPDFVWFSRLLINKGFDPATGEWLGYEDREDFVEGHIQGQDARSDRVFHRLLDGAKVYDINQDGDYCEDADGNGLISDEEILAFENLIESLNARGEFGTDPIRNTFEDSRIRYMIGLNGDANLDGNEFLAVSAALGPCVVPLPSGGSPSAASPFVMDGVIDADAQDFGGGLYIAERQGWLYVAAKVAKPQDAYVFISSAPQIPVTAPDGKAGSVGRWNYFLSRDGASATSSWHNNLGSVLADNSGQYVHARTGASEIVEGAIRKDLVNATVAYVGLGVYTDGNGGWLVGTGPDKRPPVDQIIEQGRLKRITRPEVPYGTVEDLSDAQALWRRKARWIDRDGDGACEPSYDIVITAFDSFDDGSLGQPLVLLNNNNRSVNNSAVAFTNNTTAIPPLEPATFNVDIADVDLDGRPDIVFAAAVPDATQKSIVFLLNTTMSETSLSFADLTATMVPNMLSLRFVGQGGDPAGNTRAVRFADIDGDGDFDLVMGNAGRQFGATWFGAMNGVLFNRVRGASWNSREGVARARATGSPGVVINPNLAVNLVSPSVAKRGTENLKVRIYGVNFKTGAQAYMGDSVRIVKGPYVRSSQVIEVEVTIPAGALPGPRSVSVFNPDGQSARAINGFTVTASDLVDVYQPPMATDPSVWPRYE